VSRNFDDWLTAFMDYASYGEAPRHMYFWTGVSAIAGALRRKVWIDQAYFKWYPNFYVILVAPPGIVSKSTTAGIGMDLLKKVPGVKFGPSVVTMQALLTALAESTETFEHNGEHFPMSAMTLESSEFGNLLNPHDKDMVDMLVNLWDGKEGALEKRTKHSGNDTVVNPWVNLIACTTPSWIAGNFPEYMIGGGFTSRCVFVYADQKSKYVAYPGLDVPKDMSGTAGKLVEDLMEIGSLHGEYSLTREAILWGRRWYEKLYRERPVNLDDERFGGYIARKQTHLHKLAMVLSASMSSDLTVTDEQLAIADQMLTDLEPDMAMVFSKIGKTEESAYMDRLVEYVKRRRGAPFTEVYRYVHSYFPSMRDFEDMFTGCCRAGFLVLKQEGSVQMVYPGPASNVITNA
jgi:hypothetical protein